MSKTTTVTTQLDDRYWQGTPGLITYQGPIKEKRLLDGRLLTAMDTSGSTSWPVNRQVYNLYDSRYHNREINGDTPLQIEQSILSPFNAKCLSWSDQLKGIYPNANDPAITSLGGTAPACLFTSVDSNEMIAQTEIMILATDGDIKQDQISLFSHYMNRFSNITLFIGVLASKQCRPASMNISVFASLMNSNCLIVHSDNSQGRLKLVYSHGTPTISYPCPEITNETKYAELPDMNLAQLVNLKVTQLESQVPEGYISLSGNQYVNLNLLFEQKDGLDQDLLMSINIPSLLMLCKTQGRLRDFRQWFNQYKPKVVNDFSSPIENQLAGLLSRIRGLMMRLDDDPNMKPDIRQALLEELAERRTVELPALRVKLEQERQQYQSLLKGISQNFRRFHENVLQDLHEMEKATYDLGSVRSNRAGRAEKIQITVSPDQLVLTPAEHSVFLGTDDVTYEDNQVMALILREPTDLTVNSTDFALNYPFACYNEEMASPDLVSLETAKYLTQKGTDLTRNQVLIYLPVVCLGVSTNRQFVKQQLCKAFLSGRDMSHCWRLFFSFLYNCYLKDWSEGQMREMIHWYLDQLLTYHQTSINFSAESTGGDRTVPLREAISAFLGNPELQSHPINSVLLMVNVTNMFKLPGLPVDGGRRLIREKFARHCIETLLNVWKKSTDQDEVSYKLKRLFFDYRYGVPLINSGRMVRFSDFIQLMRMYNINTKYLEKNLQFFSQLTGQLDLDQIIEPELVTVSLACFLQSDVNFTQYRPESLFEKFSLDRTFLSVLHSDPNIDVLGYVNNCFKQLHVVNTDEFTPPPYATIYGPSVLVGHEQELFIAPGIYSWGNFDRLLREGRRQYYRKIYGCTNTTPTETSANFNLHMTVRRCLQNKPEILLDRPTLLSVLKEIIKCRGNIYEDKLLEHVLMTIHSFKQVRNQNLGEVRRFGTNETTLQERAKLELIARGIPPIDDDMTPVMIPADLISKYPLQIDASPLDLDQYREILTPLTEQELTELHQ